MRLLYFCNEQAARHALSLVNLEQLKVRQRTSMNSAERRCLSMKLTDFATVQHS